jgi:hypothetical protein
MLPNEFEDLAWESPERSILEGLWVSHFKRARDEMPSAENLWVRIKRQIFEGTWNEVLDLLEAFAKRWDRALSVSTESKLLNQAILAGLDEIFESELVGFRLIGLEITPLESSAEAEAIAGALSDAEAISGARHSLERAVKLFADREAPDYPNSMKESISAVEAVVKRLTGKRTLKEGLRKLEGDKRLHQALTQAWAKMYGWLSNESGVRHAGVDAPEVDQALAKYTLVTCSAFVSYLVEQDRKLKLL